ncbi:acyl-CoA dehydrogenase family protein [Streptomyces lonegramiae]|uniref:Acyl-CoA dehydrogenase family protein n=1 Tax=Streptomyces lonegramiae TaxID=3075524 RepID=A0ABU2XPL7_9ACTN|nr:acyl-CoA dehydrogenase family protein [Streptomyces sp. DSM 41529]MDT0547425.1 acyl-CoA dehydrogenase family protein [Streptomyces sp. DSM 41529]
MTAPAPTLIEAARRLADEVLAPGAESADREGVTPAAIAAVKASGVLGVSGPAAYGGAQAPDPVAREIAEILAGACCSTYFVQAQHHSPVRMLASSASPARERLLRPLCDGTLLSGIAFSHLRAFPRTPVRVGRVAGGRRFDGRVPWYTGWGLNDVLLLGGVTEDGEVLFAFADAREQPGLRPTPPLRLAALTGTRTVGLELDGLVVPEEAVVWSRPYEEWAVADRPKNTNPNPAVFGVARAALSLLEAAGDAEAAETARVLGERLNEVRREAYALVDEVEPGERPADRLAVKTRAYDVLRAATTAAIVAGGGRAFGLGSPAQRLAREGLFLVVQGQTADVRSAHLRALRD